MTTASQVHVDIGATRLVEFSMPRRDVGGSQRRTAWTTVRPTSNSPNGAVATGEGALPPLYKRAPVSPAPAAVAELARQSGCMWEPGLDECCGSRVAGVPFLLHRTRSLPALFFLRVQRLVDAGRGCECKVEMGTHCLFDFCFLFYRSLCEARTRPMLSESTVRFEREWVLGLGRSRAGGHQMSDVNLWQRGSGHTLASDHSREDE